MENTKVTVIIPIYKVEEYLDRCMKSILSQTHSNLEIILVDDGSPDRAGEMADSYATVDNRIKVIHKINGGLASARNAGLKVATGKYVCFVDSDDSIHPEYVSTLLSICENNNCNMSICNFQDVSTPEDVKHCKVSGACRVENFETVLNEIYSVRNVVTVVAWNKLYRRELFENEIFSDGRIHEDEDLTPRMIYHAGKIGITDDELYYYFKNPSGIMGSRYSLKKLDIIWVLERRMEFYKSKGLMELYNKDSYKYLCKLLTSYYQVSHMDEKHPEIRNELRGKYNNKLKECLELDMNWSMKRRLGMKFFGLFPMSYALITGKR